MNGGIINFFVILLQFEVRKDCVTGIRIGHNFSTSIDKTFIEQLLEDIPNRLHESNVHSLVVVLKVDPSSESLDDVLPFFRVSHDDATTVMIIFFDSHIENFFLIGDFEFFIDFILNR